MTTSFNQSREFKLTEFDVVMIDASGQKNTHRSQASVYQENLGGDVNLEMILIPSNQFPMGSPETEVGHTVSESPLHYINVATLLLSKFTVTQAQWEVVMKSNPSYFKGKNRPVDSVSWEDAIQFCQRITQMTGRKYRLPSEAEWEFACRAGTTTAYHFGNTITAELATYYNAESQRRTTFVGKYPANAFGLCDMHGNVREWCQDLWHQDYKDAPKDGSAWETGTHSRDRVLRGGSWFTEPESCRSAARVSSQVYDNSYYNGFRVACSD